jgi:DNA-binding NtrC family response regulator
VLVPEVSNRGVEEVEPQGKTILVIDDEEGIRETVREILSDEGYRVFDAEDGSKAMDLIRQVHPQVVLLDIWMPEMDGIGLLREIKQSEPDLPVIIISGHGNIHTAVTTAKLGAFEFIEKPLSLDDLLGTVRQIKIRQRTKAYLGSELRSGRRRYCQAKNAEEERGDLWPRPPFGG